MCKMTFIQLRSQEATLTAFQIRLFPSVVQITSFWTHGLKHCSFSLVARAYFWGRYLIIADLWVTISFTVCFSITSLAICSIHQTFATFLVVNVCQKTSAVCIPSGNRSVLYVQLLWHLSHLQTFYLGRKYSRWVWFITLIFWYLLLVDSFNTIAVLIVGWFLQRVLSFNYLIRQPKILLVWASLCEWLCTYSRISIRHLKNKSLAFLFTSISLMAGYFLYHNSWTLITANLRNIGIIL